MTGRRRGWCPGLFEPMESGDGLLLRVKPRAATLSPAEARLVADRAEAHGNGSMNLTNRGNLQLRGFSEAGAARFASAMLAAGLADDDPAAERRRNLLVPPLIGSDPGLAPGLAALVATLEEVLADPALAALPGKFGVSVEAGGTLRTGGATADIAVETDGARALLRLAGGRHGASCPAPEAAGAVARLLRCFLAAAPATGARRMRDLVAAGGAGGVLAAAGLVEAALPEEPADGDSAPLGFARHAGTRRGAFGLGPPFGRLDATMLRAAAGLAERFGDGTIRLSARRVLLLPVAAGSASPLGEAAARAGFLVDPCDPRAAVVACTGRPGCNGASVDTGADAAAILALAAGAVAAVGGPLHLSGCAKGCAHPGPAPITLVGRDGRYGLVRNGRAGDAADSWGLGPADVATLLAGLPTPTKMRRDAATSPEFS